MEQVLGAARNDPRCPFCRDEFSDLEATRACDGCSALHHDECWDAHDGCSTCGPGPARHEGVREDEGAKFEQEDQPLGARCNWGDCATRREDTIPAGVRVKARDSLTDVEANMFCRDHALEALRRNQRALLAVAKKVFFPATAAAGVGVLTGVEALIGAGVLLWVILSLVAALVWEWSRQAGKQADRLERS